jgi:hypothetical protein
MDTGYDTDTDTVIPMIIWKNDIIQYNHKCRVDVGHWYGYVSDTPNQKSVHPS